MSGCAKLSVSATPTVLRPRAGDGRNDDGILLLSGDTGHPLGRLRQRGFGPAACRYSSGGATPAAPAATRPAPTARCQPRLAGLTPFVIAGLDPRLSGTQGLSSTARHARPKAAQGLA